MKRFSQFSLTLSLPVTRICVNYSTVYNDTLVAKGLIGTQPLFIVIILWHVIMSLVLFLSLEIIVISLNVFSLLGYKNVWN